MLRLLLPLALVVVGCSTGEPTSDQAGRWADERLWPVLEAQEHRDTPALCALLGDSTEAVREAAALAFASVQDTASRSCLLKALGDVAASVRGNAAFALGFVGDSATVAEMAVIALNEKDTLVQRALFNASFMAMQRNGLLKDPNAILYYMDRAHGQERLRAADVLRRLPDTTLSRIAPDYLRLFGEGLGADEEAILVRGLAKIPTEEARKLLRFSANVDKPAVIIPSALRAIGLLNNPADDSLLFSWVGPGCIGQAALEALVAKETLRAEQCLNAALEEEDVPTRIVLLGLAIKHGAADSSGTRAVVLLSELDANVRTPYERSAIVEAGAAATEYFYSNQDRRSAIADDGLPAVVRQAILAAEIASVRKHMMVSRYASREAQYAQLGEVVRAVVSTNDAGLISAVAELLEAEEADVIAILFPKDLEQRALSSLMPIRDLEAIMLLKKAAAKRDGLSSPTEAKVPFNHPINKEKLRKLKQGQRYRILTSKGEVVIATDVNECPGSCLAFDSLVTSGYYNGKAFHRMVPNFVVQGGCPRGDGFGGMPWTLRTEIGHKPFGAGAVGLASAGPDTESCQFFITHSAAPHLDGRYTRFGEVVSGMDVVWELGVGDVMMRVERAE